MVEIDYRKSFTDSNKRERDQSLGKEAFKGMGDLEGLLEDYSKQVQIKDINHFNKTSEELQTAIDFAKTFKSRYEQRTRFIGENTQKAIDPIFDDTIRSVGYDSAFRVVNNFLRSEWVDARDDEKAKISDYISKAGTIANTSLREQREEIMGQPRKS